MTFIDDHTRMSWVYFFTHKTDVKNTVQQFHRMVNTRFGVKIAILRMDNGTEYFNSYLTEFLSSQGTIHQSSCSYTPQQNGITQRKNRNLLEVV